MALQIIFHDPFGVTHEAAYLRVSRFLVDNPASGLKTCSGDYEIYAGREARDAVMRPVLGPQGFTFVPADANSVTLATVYNEYLKLQPEFAGAEDV